MVAIGVVLRFLPMPLIHESGNSKNFNIETMFRHDHAIVNVKQPLFSYK